MIRKMLSWAVPVGAILGPVAYYSGPEWVSGLTASLTPATSQSATEGGKGSQDVAALAEMPLEGGEVGQFWEVLRFDVTPGWIAQRWPRVTTSVGTLELQGFRVPLVTGTAPDDLAGSLTYYYNAQRQLQRITFQGSTGDYRRLLNLLATHYGFVSRPTNAPNVILFEAPTSDNNSRSYLWVQPADVLKSNEPLRKFELTLSLERASFQKG